MKIQLIPGLVSLETNAEKINCFSFWDNPAQKDFFNVDHKSKYQFKYTIGLPPKMSSGNPSLQFSNFSYFAKNWYYSNRKAFLQFFLNVNEKRNEFIVNQTYHNHFIKVGWMEPTGYLLTDYLTYILEKENLFYQVGAAGKLNNKTFIFYGFGKNFKTTLISMILANGGSYIGEEFILLNGNQVFATIPNAHPFDLRPSHKNLMSKNINKNKINSSKYEIAIFLIYSNKDKVIEVNLDKANDYVNLFQNTFNTYFYHNLIARDFLDGKSKPKRKVLTNKQARYFIIYFSAIENVYDFINKI